MGFSQLQKEGLVWSNLHMNLVTWVPGYHQDPENASKLQLSFASCDKIIKNSLCNVGLTDQTYRGKFSKFALNFSSAPATFVTLVLNFINKTTYNFLFI